MNASAGLTSPSRLVDAANAALPAAFASRLVRSPVLDAGAIRERAMADTGLSDFGEDGLQEPLDVLLAALREEARLNPLGRHIASVQFTQILKDRLNAQALFAAHPEIDRRRLARPVFVVGPMRSGTTRLHRLLAADSRFAHLRAFEAVNPVPRPDFRPGQTDRRWIAARLALGAIHLLNPAVARIHPTGPFEPEEELGLLVRSLWGMKHEAQWHVPSYGRWSEAQDATPAYRHMARLLRLVGWARQEDDTRPWVLKTPQHMLDLPALLRVFPDARFVFIHRDPCAVVGSSCSLVWNQTVLYSNHADARRIGRDWLRKTELQIERMRKARLRIAPDQRIDLRFGDMERDWQAAMRRVYDFLGMDMAPVLPAMERFIARSEPARRAHPHRYSLDAFGLDAGAVRERFAAYVDAFALDAAPKTESGQGRAITRIGPVAAPPAPGPGFPAPAWAAPMNRRATTGRR